MVRDAASNLKYSSKLELPVQGVYPGGAEGAVKVRVNIGRPHTSPMLL